MFKDEKCPFSKNHYFKTTLLRQRMSRRLSGRERAGSTLPFQDHQNSVAERLPSVRDLTASDVIQPRMTRFGRSPIMAGICPPTRTAGSRPSVQDPAYPWPEWPDPSRLAGIWLFPDQKLGRGGGRVRDCLGCWVPGGSGLESWSVGVLSFR